MTQFFIRLYQLLLSPLLGSHCCYYPSCSEYAKLCFKKYPWQVALNSTMRRLLRCHPKSEGGVDFP